MTDNPQDIACQEIVEIVTAYLEGELDPSLRARFDAHLTICTDCVLYVDQMRLTIELTGASAPASELPPELREGLSRAFDGWAGPGSAG
jgi:predicted anti-sigma-YlaC factor YlaD